MRDSTKDGFWDRPRNGWILTGVTLLVSLVLLFGNLGGIGIWEPWESNEISVAQEYATRGAPPESTDPKAISWNSDVPTYKKRLVNRPLLKTMVLSKAVGSESVKATDLGSLERRARAPIAAATLLLVILGFAWLRRRFGTFAAAVSTLVFVSLPATYLGVHNLASEMLFVVGTTLAIMAFAELTLEPKRRWLWGPVFGLSLCVCVADHRLMGLYLPLLVLGAFAVGEVVLAEAIRRRDGPSAPRRFGPTEVIGALLSLGGVAATVAWCFGVPAGDKGGVPTYALQILTIIVPALLVFGMFWFARKSKPGRAFWSLPGLVGVGLGVAMAIWVARSYSAANPILLDGGKLFGDVRVFAFMVANHLFENSVAESHLTFDVAVRQVGFSLFPWVGLFPLGFVYVSRATRTRDDGREIGAELFADRLVIRRLLLVWMVGSAIVLSVASAWQHYFYPAYFPIAVSIGLVLTDEEFWTRARRNPLAPYAAGFVAIALVLMLGKDLERFPARFIETYLTLQEGVEFPDDFKWGAFYKPLKYVICAALALHFFGLVSWSVLLVRKLKKIPELFAALRRRDWDAVLGEPSDAPFVERMAQKEAVRNEDGVIAALARVVETPVGFAPGLAVLLAAVAAAFLFSFIPNVTHHLSQRGVFETYTQVAEDGEKLWRYQVSSRDNSVYLTDLETVKGGTDLGKLFDSEERFFAVIPRAKLASVNYDVRNKFKRNLAVLDTRSSRLLLVSNQLKPTETDKSFVADKIVVGEPTVDFPVTWDSDGDEKHAVFDGQLEFLGYSLDGTRGANGMVEYGWGDVMTITYYFKVLKRVPSSQKVFLHVDYPGNRINGDHVPNDGEFTTNYWMPGDVVKDVHPLKIDSYSTPGIYTLNMGFFLGSRRMKVEPREAHDGKNRITIGKIKVTSGL